MFICSICSVGFLPANRWRDEWCPDCHTRNFAASDELRLHDQATDALREATHQHYEAECRATWPPTAWPPTPGQIEARQRLVARWRREAQEEV